MMATAAAVSREVGLRRGVALEAVTIGYNALEGIIAIAAGLAAGSVALTGFGVDSVIEVTSGVVLWWRLRAELGAPPVGTAVEARAGRVAGLLLVVLAGYLVVESGRLLLVGARAETSIVGLAITFLSLIVLPLLARANLRGAAALRIRAHRLKRRRGREILLRLRVIKLMVRRHGLEAMARLIAAQRLAKRVQVRRVAIDQQLSNSLSVGERTGREYAT